MSFSKVLYTDNFSDIYNFIADWLPVKYSTSLEEFVNWCFVWVGNNPIYTFSAYRSMETLRIRITCVDDTVVEIRKFSELVGQKYLVSINR